MLITDVKMLICSNAGKRARQGHYKVNRSEITENVEGKQSWYSRKPLTEWTFSSPKVLHASPWKKSTYREKK